MRENVQRDYARSVRALRDTVFPVLIEHCPEFQGMQVEVLANHQDRLTHDLDTIAGIDAYLRSPLALRPIAARVQYVSPFRTFTIRVARSQPHVLTELQKRLSQLAEREAGTLSPYWTIHAYLFPNETHLACVGVAKTSELYFWIAQQYANRDLAHPKEPFKVRQSNEQEHFLIVPWDQYRASGHYFFEYPAHV